MSKLFTLEKTEHNSKARAGLLKTDHSEIPTPVFMPVGTQATVKALQPRELAEIGSQIILGNTYHLYLRPGSEVIKHLGGLHKFMNWDRSILTDSGGYQVFSLKELRKLTDDGVEFKSHIDGSRHFFSPEKVVGIQRTLGSDIVMVLDECTPYPATKEETRKSIDLSAHWAERSKAAFHSSEPVWGHRQFLFAIGQGSMYPDMRREYLQKMIDIDFDGYAIGGLSVGEPAEMMYETAEVCTEIMPEDKPRYLMGVGTPENILEAIDLGIDMFDCVLPTRNARNGQLFTTKGKINIRNSRHRLSDQVIDDEIDSYASRNFSLGYIRHLFNVNEILGIQLATHHNISFYQWLTKTARLKILSGEYRQWKQYILQKMKNNDE